MCKSEAPVTDTFPLFLTLEAQAGNKLPSNLLNQQMHILLSAGVAWERLNPDLRATFLFGYYLGNVRNGGHSQFMGNARNYYHGDPVRFLGWAMEAAERYKMPETLAIMRDVQDWMVRNPKEAAIQTGFTPYVSPELKPYDAALFSADTVDEETWLARVNTLPGALTQTFLTECGYQQGYIQFPAIVSQIEELRFLAAFDFVKIVAPETFEAEVKAVAATDPVARDSRLRARLTDLAQSLPKPATCAALSLFSGGAHLSPTVCLRAGAAKTRQPRRTAVLATKPHDRAFVFERGIRRLSVFEAEGDPDALLENAISFPATPRGVIARLVSVFDPKRLAARRFKHLARQKSVRKIRKLGEVSHAVGDEIAALNRRFHLAEALALWLEQAHDSTVPTAWRLELVEADSIQWRFEAGRTHLCVVASAKEVRISAEGATLVYLNEDLATLRQHVGA